MMLVALIVESPEQIRNYLDENCISGGRDPVFGNNCTTFTLTKIKDVTFPSFGPPSFGLDYEFCNKREGDEWQYDSEGC